MRNSSSNRAQKNAVCITDNEITHVIHYPVQSQQLKSRKVKNARVCRSCTVRLQVIHLCTESGMQDSLLISGKLLEYGVWGVE